jgi:hypothetical protein
VEMVGVAEHSKLTSPEDQGVHRWIGERGRIRFLYPESKTE